MPDNRVIAPLTSLRGLAAPAVMGFHFLPLMAGVAIFNRGFLGADLFLLLSGCILTHVYRQRLTSCRSLPPASRGPIHCILS